jgi:hypothetical protein
MTVSVSWQPRACSLGWGRAGVARWGLWRVEMQGVAANHEGGVNPLPARVLDLRLSAL